MAVRYDNQQIVSSTCTRKHPSPPSLLKFWLRSGHKDNNSAIETGMELFYASQRQRKSEPKSASQAHDKEDARITIDDPRAYIGRETFTASFRKALGENKPWPNDISVVFESGSEELLYLEEVAVQSLMATGLPVSSAVADQWASRHADKLHQIDPEAADAVVNSMAQQGFMSQAAGICNK